MSSRPHARPVALAAAAVVSAALLAGCGGHRDVATPSPTTGASTSTSRPAEHTSPPVALVNPLTGEPVDHSLAHRVAVVVKIDNIQQALPQTGVNQADVVYEEMVEGGLSRLAAVFLGDYPHLVGPVRSGRLTDEGIADDLNHPVLAYAGTNGIFQPILAAQPLHVVEIDNYPDLFFQTGSNVPPHNTYIDVAKVAATVSDPSGPEPLWEFRKSDAPFTGPGAAAASSVSIDFPAAAVLWSWDSRSRTWLRTQNGVPDNDSAGQRLSAANVIVQFIPYVTSAYVSGEGASAQGTPIPTGEMVGSGTAYFLSGGTVVRGTWQRASLTSRTVYRNLAGQPIRLAPGRTWVELPEIGSPIHITH
jgi:hypothetical protein